MESSAARALPDANAFLEVESLFASAAFTPRSLQYPEAWVGHLPFAAWLIRELSPAVCVELGTHSGNSYFSFCQAVAETGVSTRCYAVDTWQGDDHAGHYDEQVFAEVSAHHREQQYERFSRLVRMTFDEAAPHFSSESIDLLHIDGLHTYEAVRRDFETWRPKLAPGAVVLLHDTNVRERDFGVWRFWEELQAVYPSNLQFLHSHGLGVMQLNDAPEDRRRAWLQSDSPVKQRLIDYFAALGSRQLDRYELKDIRRHTESLNQALAERDGRIDRLNHDVAERGAHIGRLHHDVAEREGRIDHLHREVAERQDRIDRLHHEAAEREGRVDCLHHEIAERDDRLAGVNETVVERDVLIAQMQASNSWHITAPLRALRRWMTQASPASD